MTTAHIGFTVMGENQILNKESRGYTHTLADRFHRPEIAVKSE